MSSDSATIVVGYDGSPSSAAAVEHAARQAAGGGRVVVVHAYEVPPDYMGAPYYEDMLAEATRRSEDAMRTLESGTPALAEVDHETEVLAGDPGAAILNVASTHGADMIVLGSHGRGRMAAMLLGSVAQRVLHGAACPVLIIPPRMAGGS